MTFSWLVRGRWRAGWAACALLLLSVLALGAVNAQPSPTFRVGVLDETDGPIARGAQLAVNEINAQGGVQGADGTRFLLELVVEPTSFGADIESAVATVNLASVIAVLGPRTTDEVLGNLPLLQSLGVPVMTPATGDTIIALDNSGRLVRTRATDVLQERALADYLVNDLGLTDVATVQLDVPATANVIGFRNAATGLGLRVEPGLLLSGSEDITSIIQDLADAEVQGVVAFGSPALASNLYVQLRAAGYTGVFAYNQVDERAFRDVVPTAELQGVVAATTWPLTATDDASTRFLLSFVRTFGVLPGAVEAASYDAVQVLAQAIGRPGELADNLRTVQSVNGVQGVLLPPGLAPGELSDNTAVVRLGNFGAPDVVARFAGARRLPSDAATLFATPTLLPTPTPEGVVGTVISARLNVRTGPSTQFDAIGQLREGDQVQILGTSQDGNWAAITFRGQTAWVSTDPALLSIFGNINTVPIVQAPALPTPGPTPLPAPQQEADIVVQAASVTPNPIVPNQPFSVVVTVANTGLTAAGPFVVAATFPPNNVFTSAQVAGLAPGQSTNVVLSGTLQNTGQYTVVVVADLNNEVPEGPAGEANNNTFTLSYRVDRTIRNQGSQTLNPGTVLDLEGASVQTDMSWNINGQQLDAINGAAIGVLPGATVNTVTYDLINTATANRTSIPRGELAPGTILAVLTAEGNRAVIRVDDVPGNQLRITFYVYN